ncbi:CotO family spore coat protein [Bacillus cereus]|nr:CotO family spore coat protein [Bacillus cereus]
MSKKKSNQKKNMPTVYMRPLDDGVLEQYMQSTFVLKKDTLTKEKHIVQPTDQEVQQDAQNIEDFKEQLEENEESVAEFKEQLEENEESVEEFKEQLEENEAGVVEFKEQSEENIAEQVEEVQKNVVSNDQDRGKNSAEVQKDKQKSVSFRKMTNEEKVYYLLNRPHYIPKVNCFFRTHQDSYIGYITSYDNGILKIKSSTRLIETTININEIIIIQMIGT